MHHPHHYKRIPEGVPSGAPVCGPASLSMLLGVPFETLMADLRAMLEEQAGGGRRGRKADGRTYHIEREALARKHGFRLDRRAQYVRRRYTTCARMADPNVPLLLHVKGHVCVLYQRRLFDQVHPTGLPVKLARNRLVVNAHIAVPA